MNNLENAQPPAAVLTATQLKLVLAVFAILLSGAVGWASWVTIQVNDTQREVAVISSNRYTPKDRLQDLQAETQRFDQMSNRIDTVYERLGVIEGDLKELKAVMIRLETAVSNLARKVDQ